MNACRLYAMDNIYNMPACLETIWTGAKKNSLQIKISNHILAYFESKRIMRPINKIQFSLS